MPTIAEERIIKGWTKRIEQMRYYYLLQHGQEVALKRAKCSIMNCRPSPSPFLSLIEFVRLYEASSSPTNNPNFFFSLNPLSLSIVRYILNKKRWIKGSWKIYIYIRNLSVFHPSRIFFPFFPRATSENFLSSRSVDKDGPRRVSEN